jgi:hypothetical protein
MIQGHLLTICQTLQGFPTIEAFPLIANVDRDALFAPDPFAMREVLPLAFGLSGRIAQHSPQLSTYAELVCFVGGVFAKLVLLKNQRTGTCPLRGPRGSTLQILERQAHAKAHMHTYNANTIPIVLLGKTCITEFNLILSTCIITGIIVIFLAYGLT